MKVLCTGLSRTGTSSLHQALQLLGLSSLHYDSQRLAPVFHPARSQFDFRIYDDVDAVSDLPAAWFYEEFLEAYPGLKCIHTVREETAWWRSIETHFNHRHPVPTESADPFRWRLRHWVYGSATAQEFLYRRKYREHNDRVRAVVPPDRLLVMNIAAGDGWEKLCPFLGTPIPEAAFPHENSREQFNAWREKLRVTREELRRLPGNAPYVLVDEDQLRGEIDERAQAIPFLNRGGQYWGPPPDDQTAIRECEQLRDAGARFVVFAWPAFWWLDHYTGFHRHLRSRFDCWLESDRLVIFDLHSNPQPTRAA